MTQFNPYIDLDAKEAALRQRIADDQKSLQEIQMLKALTTKYLPQVVISPSGSTMKIVDAATALGAVTRQMDFAKNATKREKIIDGVRKILADGQRWQTRDLIPMLQFDYGVDIGGNDPVTLLSSYLSKEKKIFQSDYKAGGWALVASREARPGNEQTLPGLFTNGSHAAQQ